MRIDRIELTQIHMPLVHFFETSFGRTYERTIVLVRVYSGEEVGWGEVTAGETPFYSHETYDTAWIVIKKFIAPRILNREFENLDDVSDIWRPIRGHNMAKAAVETALWELEARRRGLSLSRLLGGTRPEIECGVSIGIQENVFTLLKKIETEVHSGYRRIKIKIKPGWDVSVVAEVRKHFPRILLMGDANSAYTLADVEVFKRLDEFHLMMIEQPLHWNDLLDHAELQRQIKTPICLDESIHDVEDARKAIEIGACQIINMKLGRVGGYSEARKIHDLAQSKGIPVWCGGMLESGIGRVHNIALSSLANFKLPGDVSASLRYWKQDIIDPEVEVSPRGTITVPTGPGLGYRPSIERIEKVTERHEVLQ
ncbi:MAG: o-succinylbenzoate synthase [Acidobacteriia bacterium]|nr:o-succinylbenzoate synthase [Terriglobia bacterium]